MKYASRLLIRTQTWALIIEFTTLAVVDSSLRPTCADSEVVLQKSCSVLLKGVGRGERAVRGFESTRPKVCQAPAPNDDGERRRRLVHSPPALEPPPPPPSLIHIIILARRVVRARLPTGCVGWVAAASIVSCRRRAVAAPAAAALAAAAAE